jgi:hypothetical protein
MVIPELELSKENLTIFELEFRSNLLDQEMEIYSILYEVDAQGEIIF